MALKLSENGLISKQRELESLEKQLHENRIYKNKIAVDNGNVWHDNNDFEQCEIEERRLMKSISDIKEEIHKAEIISSKSCTDIVDYGAIVELQIDGDDFSDYSTILFSDSDEESKYEKIFINSPVGSIIYQQKVGFTGQYSVNGNKLTVKILDVKYES